LEVDNGNIDMMTNLIDTNVAAARAGVTREAIRLHIESGNLPAGRFGHVFAIELTDFERWLADWRLGKFDQRGKWTR
jgi:hypothetical protein